MLDALEARMSKMTISRTGKFSVALGLSLLAVALVVASLAPSFF
jgi:hypothetical protein